MGVVKGFDKRKCTVYNHLMIKTFRHKGVEQFFQGGSKAGIQPEHSSRLRVQLTRLDVSRCPEDMGAPGWKLHRLKGDLSEFWSVRWMEIGACSFGLMESMSLMWIIWTITKERKNEQNV